MCSHAMDASLLAAGLSISAELSLHWFAVLELALDVVSNGLLLFQVHLGAFQGAFWEKIEFK